MVELDADRLVTRKEAAEIVRLSQDYFSALVRDGKLPKPFVQPTKRRAFWRVADLMRWKSK